MLFIRMILWGDLMKKKLSLLLLLFLVCILSISAISATENTANNDVMGIDNNKENNLETNIYSDVSTGNENCKLSLEQNNNDKLKDTDELNFTDLNRIVNGNSNSTINLSNNYKYNEESDQDFVNGIIIDRDLTIYGNGITLNGNSMARIFNVIDSNLNVSFYDIHFKNGHSSNNGGAIRGGTAYNCNFNDNYASNGGAICGGTAYNCTFKDNEAKHNGGAIFDGNAYYCTFTGNEADDGGAMYNSNAYNCTFTENNADNGGAMYNSTADGCLFKKNEADTYGGAIRYGRATNCDFVSNLSHDHGAALSQADAYNSTFTENEAYYHKSYCRGGAIDHGNAYNCTFTKNKGWHGGAIYVGNAYNCIFKKNYAFHYGGAMYDGDAYNCIFTDNEGDDNVGSCGGAMYHGNAYNCTFTKNDADDMGEAMYGGKAALCKFSGNSNDDTDIIDTAINVLNYVSTYKSGERLKFNLTAGDVLLDGFNTTIEISKEGQLYTTVYGLSGEGWIVDLAPGEYTAVLSLTDFPKEKSSSATITVRSTFTDLNATINGNNNSTIYLSNNDYYKYDTASDNELINGIIINRDLTIYGNGATIDGDKIARIFKVENNVNVKFLNINFRNGKADYGGAICGGNAYNCSFTNNTADYGGAIYLGNATDCTFANNAAEKDGGAMYKSTAYNCTFTENNADNVGGAIYECNATDSTFANNTAESGGAMYGGNAYKCIFEENKADTFGGAMYKSTAYDCTFTENKAVKGGAIYQGNANNCTFTKNTAEKDGCAIFKGDAINCTFIGNTAHHGGAMNCEDNNRNYTAEGCTFIGNSADGGGATYGVDVFNCIFTNNTSTCDGGAVYKHTAVNCTFTGNTAERDGGAIFKGDAINCTFIGNSAKQHGGAMYEGTACLCIFNEDSTKDTKIIHPVINVLNYTSTYNSGEKLKFNLTANDMVFDGFKTSIAIYKNTSLVKTAYALTGEGWIVDLGPGEYTAVLSLTDYSGEGSSNATISVSKGNTFIDISPIINAKVGQELTIKYSTNSNGTVTVKVNGQKISGPKFTPTKEGSYNVSVDVAENDYYTAASNETAFTVEKTVAVVVISPVADVVVGQEVTIKYDTNSNGTVTVKVNGQKISGAKFTPTKEGSYVVTVDVAENDYYTAASNQTKFTVEKIDNYTADINVGEDNVTVILPEDINGKLTVKVGNEIFTVPVKNGVAVIPYDDLPVGENSITVTYPGDSKYAEKSFDFNVTVKPKVIITVKDLIKYYGSPDRFIVNIKDSEGRPIAGQIVYITLNGRTYNKTTDNKGMASIGVNLNSGKYTATVTVNETKLTAKITVLSTINGKNIVKIFHNATQYYVTARDSNGNYLPENTEIDFNINGVFYKRKVTGDKGLAKLNINLIPNTYIITAYNTVTGERTSNNITVLSRLTENKNITMYEKNGTKYTVRVLDETGKAVGAGENVTFNINGVLYTRTTDSNGYAALNINLMSGNYIITAMYGDSKVANNIKILPRLVASNLIKKYGTPDQFKAQLLDSKGNPVVGEKITFNINGIFYYRPTDADGFAKLNINLMPGKYIITSSYGSFVCGNTVTVNA